MIAGLIGLAPGNFHSIVVKKDGSVWSTGVKPDPKQFVQVIASGAIAAATGNHFTIVLKQDGSVWITSQNSHDQLDFFDALATSEGTYYKVNNIMGAEAVAAGSYHAMVMSHDGSVWTTGWNMYGQLGDGSTEDSTGFREVISGGVEAVAAGDGHSIVVKQDGSVWAVGRNSNGQLGDGSTVDRSTFVRTTMSGVSALGVTAGGDHSMVLKQDGSVWATGWNQYGQLGDGSREQRVDYTQVVSSGATLVAAGSQHSLMLKLDGSVWSTGNNEYGQLGTGSTGNSLVFMQVILDGATSIAAGDFQSMVLKQDGSVWATGSNRQGIQFGDGSTEIKTTFVKLAIFGNGSLNHYVYLDSY